MMSNMQNLGNSNRTMLKLSQRYFANFFNDRVTVETNELEQLIKE